MVFKNVLRSVLSVGFVMGVTGATEALADSHGGMASAKMLSATCDACHGPNGNSFGPAIPSIAGMNDLYLTDAMMQYKSGERPSTIMGRIAKGYTDDELKAIAKHFASQKTMRQLSQEADPKLVEMGQKITRDLCEGCHEKDGYAAEDYPYLAGQMMPYLRNNLMDFHSGLRSIDNNPVMSAKEKRKKKNKLKDMRENYGADAPEAVVQFYGSRK